MAVGGLLAALLPGSLLWTTSSRRRRKRGARRRQPVAYGRHPERGAGHVRFRYPAYVGAGVAASALAALLGYAQKLPCSSGGAWNSFTGQFHDACYTDIYPLYYNEGLSAGKVPYYGHPVEYPVLIGAMMQVAAWAVHSVTDPYSRGRDFYYVTVVLLAICLVAGVLATAATAHREGDGAGWKAALLVALSPALILAAFINWDLFAMALAAGGLAAWAAQRQYLAGVLLGLAVATKFYPLLFFGALLLLCLRAGRMREFGQAFGAGLLAWLVVNLPVAIGATAGLGPLLRVQPGPGRRLGIGLVPVRALQRARARQLRAGHAEPDVVGRLRPRVRAASRSWRWRRRAGPGCRSCASCCWPRS